MLKRLVLFLILLFVSFSVLVAQIQIKVTLSGVPSSLTIQKKNLKYGKFGAFCFGWDDRAPSALDALSVMSAHSFTDGAGNEVPYTGFVACNGVNRYYQDASGLTIPQLTTLIQNNWGIACHGYIHDVSIWADQGFTVLDNVIQNRTYFYNKFKDAGVEYVLRTGAVPNNDGGYQIAWKQIGSLCGTSESTFDGMTANPEANWANNSIGDLTNFTGQYQVFARAFKDIVDQAGEDHLNSKFVTLIEQSTESSNKVLVFGTHNTDNNFFGPALDNLHATSNDNIWVTSLHELMEYGETKDKTNISYTLNGNELTINLSQNLPDANRWRDISLGLVSDKNIVSLSYTGADKVTYNPSTGLINVFKKKTSGFADPSLAQSPLPLHFTNFTLNNNRLSWIVADNETVSHFEVEKSTDGTNFHVIAKTNVETYSDPSASGNSFYRIKAVEKNGSYIYSNILRVSASLKNSATIQVQNGKTSVSFYSESDRKGNLEVYGTNGQLVFKSVKQVLKGWNSWDLDVQAAGVYIIKTPVGTMKYVKAAR